MAHFARLDQNSIVVEVLVVNNETLGDLPFPESEPVGIAFLRSLFGEDTEWKQCSYNKNFRKNYPGTGFSYNSELDLFIPPQPSDKYILNLVTYKWFNPNTPTRTSRRKVDPDVPA
jgi:hypothetical protein